MALYFITGSSNKFAEAKEIIPGIEQLEIDLPEIQDSDPKNIIEAKLKAAFKHKRAEFFVEDTGLYFECLNNKLPGPLVKWFLKAVDREGLYEIAKRMGNTKAIAKAVIGYARKEDDIYFFEGEIAGEIVAPRGESGFGWDPIFQPMGYSKTFAEMTLEEKNKISHRKEALLKLEKFLETQ